MYGVAMIKFPESGGHRADDYSKIMKHVYKNANQKGYSLVQPTDTHPDAPHHMDRT